MAGIVERVDGDSVLLILCAALVAHLLQVSSPSIKRMVVGCILKDSNVAIELRQDVSDLTKEQSGLSVVNDFVKYSRLQRKLNQKQKALDVEESLLRNQRRRFQLVLAVLLKLTEVLVHAVTALSFWNVSLIVLDKEQLWKPLGVLLSLPKGAVGEVSVSIWMLFCRQTLALLSQLLM